MAWLIIYGAGVGLMLVLTAAISDFEDRAWGTLIGCVVVSLFWPITALAAIGAGIGASFRK